MKLMETAVHRHAAEHRPVLAQALDPVPNIDGSFRIQEPLGGMFFVELCLERLPLIQPTKAITSKIRVNMTAPASGGFSETLRSIIAVFSVSPWVLASQPEGPRFS